MQKLKGVLVTIIFAIVLGIFMPKTSCYASEGEKVRVGFFTAMPHMMDIDEESGAMSGYAYDYLQMISNYTDWEYEYVIGEWNDLWTMLHRGEIDLMADVSYSKDRENGMLFPEREMGNEVYRMYTGNKNSSIDAFNLTESLKGKKIGVRDNTVQMKMLEDWIEKRGIECEVIPYVSEILRNSDLDHGIIDAVVEVEESSKEYWEPIIEIGSSEYYLVVAKNRPDLLEELNVALDSIYVVSPQFLSELYFKYYADVVVSSRLTEREKNWADSHEYIKVGYLVSDETNHADEMLEELFTSILNELGLSNIKVQLFGYSSASLLTDSLSNSDVDVIYPAMNNEYVAEKLGQSLVTPIDSISYRIVTRKGETIDSVSSVGICYGPLTEYYLNYLYSSYNTRSYKSQKEGLDAIASGEIDLAIMDEYGLEDIMYSSTRYSNLTAVGVNDVYYKCIATKKGNTGLFMLLERGVSLLDSKYISSLSVKYNRVESVFSLKQFLISNISIFAILLVLISIAIITLVIYIGIRKSEKLRKISETDSLTGITNRSGEKKIRKHIENNNEGMFCLMDIDKFKIINDTYGHEAGDAALIELANSLKRVFRSDDVILRLGGDEFAVFVLGVINEEVATMILKRLIADVDNICIPEMNDTKISISIGASFFHKNSNLEFEKLYKRADMGCYSSKKMEGSCYTFVS